MLWRDTVSLVRVTRVQNEIGDWVEVTTSRQVAADKLSLSRNEFHQAAIAGIKAEMVFLVWTFEYQDEILLDYANKRYEIYRTYDRDDERTELYCRKQVP